MAWKNWPDAKMGPLVVLEPESELNKEKPPKELLFCTTKRVYVRLRPKRDPRLPLEVATFAP